MSSPWSTVLMHTKLIFVGISASVFLGMVAMQLLGRSLTARHRARGEPKVEGSSTIEAAVFGLLGLLVAFSFSGAETRLQARRDLIVREVNAIGTAYLRIDLLPEAERAEIKQDFRDYVDARVTYYRNVASFDTALVEKARAEALQQKIWKAALGSAGHAPDLRATVLIVPALNEMFDVTTAREAAIRMHIPLPVFLMLGLLSLACAFLAGRNMAEGVSSLHIFTFAGTMALTAYIILNIEFPRLGFVRLDALDTFLLQVRATMT